MKTKVIAALVVAVLLGGLFMASAASARIAESISEESMEPLRCQFEMDVVWAEMKWIGTVTGDITGSITVFEMPGVSFPGKTEHFHETWVIETDSGSISGFEDGVWSFVTFKFVANGRVTGATGSWTDLAGSNMRYSGTTTEFLGVGFPIHGSGTLMIMGRLH